MKQVLVLIGLVALLTLVGQFSVPNKESVAAPTVSDPTLSITPDVIHQGDPALIVVEGLATSSVVSLTWNERSLNVFVYDGKPSALIGIDLQATTGTSTLVATLSDGRTITHDLIVSRREIAEAPLGIPEKLGGNTSAAAKKLALALTKENALLAHIPTTDHALWSEPFGFPVAHPAVTDTYGYTRLSSGTTISHRGTDFHAPAGTAVYAVNDGVVALTEESVVYGKAIVVDHGFGLQTLYMHLSEIDVREGEAVTKGALLGKSGDSGYAEGPHLHLSVKIDGVSVDPMVFLSLF